MVYPENPTGAKVQGPCELPIPQILTLPFPLPHPTWAADGRFAHSSRCPSIARRQSWMWMVPQRSNTSRSRPARTCIVLAARIFCAFIGMAKTPSVEVPLSDFFAIGHETGSSVLFGLPYLHQAMLAWGGRSLSVTVIDADTVSPTNCVRQPFGVADIGQNKATVLVNRVNLFHGLQWAAMDEFFQCGHETVRYVLPRFS